MEYGYSRTSTADQDGAGGLHVLAEAGIPPERIFFDRGISGMKSERPALSELLSVVQPGDQIFTPTFSRLGRSTQNVLTLIENLEKQSVGLVILDLGIDTSTPVGRLTVTVLSAVNWMTRDLIAESTRDALAARKASAGKAGCTSQGDRAGHRVMTAMRDAGISPAVIAGKLGLGRYTVYRVLASQSHAPV